MSRLRRLYRSVFLCPEAHDIIREQGSEALIYKGTKDIRTRLYYHLMSCKQCQVRPDVQSERS